MRRCLANSAGRRLATGTVTHVVVDRLRLPPQPRYVTTFGITDIVEQRAHLTSRNAPWACLRAAESDQGGSRGVQVRAALPVEQVQPLRSDQHPVGGLQEVLHVGVDDGLALAQPDRRCRVQPGGAIDSGPVVALPERDLVAQCGDLGAASSA